MKILDFLGDPKASGGLGDSPHPIVMSSRVRLARNVRQHVFPGHATKAQRTETLEEIRPEVEALEGMQGAYSETMDHLTAVEKKILVERHLISREHAERSGGSGLVISPDQRLCVMVNEEDHLRMQALRPGLQITEAWEAVNALDTALERRLDFAFSPEWGYLTACPTNLGTGIRVSAMLHLPGLVLSEQINQVVQAVNKLGLAVRGLHGEGTEALGNVFQVSNQMTLGESEEEIIQRIQKVLAQIIQHEENAREVLMEKNPKTVYNHIGRAYGILCNAYIISSKEAMNLLSLVRLGIDLGLFEGVDRLVIDELFMTTQPAHLQSAGDGKLAAQDRDILRADMLRARLRKARRPRFPDGRTDAAGGE